MSKRKVEEGDPPPIPAKKPRGKSDAQKEHDANHVYSTVQVKLNVVLLKHDAELAKAVHTLLNDCASNLSRIAFEAYLLANTHVLRLLREGKPLLELNQSFFKSCCVLVSKTVKGGGDDELRASMEEYRALRPEGWTVPENEYMSELMSTLAREMETMTQNHIVLNFNARVTRYVRIKYKLSCAKEAASFIRSSFMDSDRMLTWDQKEFKAWIGLNPFFEDTLKKNKGHFLLKLYEILAYFESLEPGTKGVRTFTLLPTKGGFVGSFALIDETTLPVILKKLPQEIQERIVRTLVSQTSEGSVEREFLEKRLTTDAVFCPEFAKNKEVSRALWHLLFNTRQYETENRKFRYLISTNGYASTIYLQKPKPRGYDEKKREEPQYDRVPRNFDKYDNFIGIDPGRTYVASAFSGEVVDGRSKCIQVSTKEIRHDSKMNEQRGWENRLRRNEAKYQEALKALPSLKTSNLETFKENVRLTLREAEFLFAFCRDRAFRAWRFKVSIYSKQAISKAVDKILDGKDKSKTLVGFGDWSQQDGFLKGTEKAPVKKMRKEMRKAGVKVIAIDEYRTSKCCSQCCASFVDNVSFWKKKTKKQSQEDKLKLLRGEEVKKAGKMVKSHQLVRCLSNECPVYWQRDVNASRNIYSILRSVVEGRVRPPALCRGSRFTETGKLLGEHAVSVG